MPRSIKIDKTLTTVREDFLKIIQREFPENRLPIGIVGVGKSGVSAQKLLEALGFQKGRDFFLYDDKNPSEFLNADEFLNQTQVRSLLISPGVPLSKKWIQDFRKKNGFIFSEISLGALLLNKEKCIGVTGSLGKSTTTSLIGHALKSVYPDTFVGGNLGTPLCEYFLELLEGKRTTRANFIVLELSSYQLENCEKLRLDYSAITYLSPNHLERYDSLEEYYKTKWKIFDFTKNQVFLNSNGGDIVSFSEKNGPGLVQSTLVQTNPDGIQGIPFSKSPLVGRHNWENISLAAAVIEKLGLPKPPIDVLFQFAGLAHRLQYIGFSNARGIHFINDSKATAIESVTSAIEAVTYDPRFSNHSIFLLVGGKDKKLPWSKFAESLKTFTNVKVILFGELRESVKKVLADFSIEPLAVHQKLEDVFPTLLRLETTRSVVLLSPGGTSLDEFQNFEARGQKFEFYCQKYFNDFKHV
jgi:UDP-N-acetylmuramoylalanine--D-glutamate ligase